MTDSVSRTPVIIRKVKRPQGFARWSAYAVAEDDHGLWLYSPPGTLFRSFMNGVVGFNEVGRGSGAVAPPVLHLMPGAGWWMAQWMYGGPISIEICTPPAPVDGEWVFIDLEIDPLLRPDGHLEIHDVDEFEEACRAGHIGDDEAAQARAATAEIERCLKARVEPFGQRGWDLLEIAMQLPLPPVTHLPLAAGEPVASNDDHEEN